MDIFRRAVDIRSGEYGRTGLMFSCMFLLIAAYVVMKAVRDSLFLYKLGVAQLPLVYILVGVGVLLALITAVIQKYVAARQAG